METPATNQAGYDAADVTKVAKDATGRLFLIHGNMDENVHYANTARLIDALIAAKKPFDLLVFPGERHGNRSPLARAYVNQRIAEFFAELGNRLIIEFVPKSDPMVQTLLANREDIFPTYDRAGFEQAFGAYFEIERSEPVTDTDRVMYLLRRK